MKKYFVFASLAFLMLALSYCSSSKKTASAGKGPVAAPKSSYAGNLESLIMGNCSPCHIPSKGGNKKAYDNFANVKADIDEIIRRIQLNPGERGFMPMRKPKLSDSTIAVFKQWKEDGLLEK